MNRPLKQAVRDHFDQQVLSGAQVKRLESLMQVNQPHPGVRRIPWQRLTTWSVSAAVAAILAVIVLFPPSLLDEIPVTQRIALEVARNHIRLKPLDVKTDSMDAIRRYFTDLDFMPVQSSLLSNSNLAMLGGRYCSIQSLPAAQLRLTQPGSNGLKTLYQTEYRREVFGPLPVLEKGEAPVTEYVKGITVRIWVEKGLLFALTETSTLEPIIPAGKN